MMVLSFVSDNSILCFLHFYIVLGISLTQLNYDTGTLTISVSKMEGELAPEYSFSAFLETVLNSGIHVMITKCIPHICFIAIGNITNTTISNELIFDRFHVTYHFDYKVPNEESLYKIVVHLSSLNETIPVSIQTSILSATLQGEFSQDSNLQIIESTSTTGTTDSTRSTALGTGTTIGAVTTIGTVITIGTGSTGFTSSTLISTSNINSTSTIGANSDACSTIFVIQPEQTNTTSLATEPFSLPLKNSQVNHENILVYVGVASAVLVISLLACIMTLTASILLYRRRRRKSEQVTRNPKPTIVHPTLATTNSSDTENAPKTNAMVLVRPRASRSAIRSRFLAIEEEHFPRTMLDENPCEQVSMQQHDINPSLDDEEILSSHAFHPQDVELTASELEFAKTLGSIENSSMNAESQL